MIAKYFEPAERLALYKLLGIPTPSDDQITADAHSASGTGRARRQLEPVAMLSLGIAAAERHRRGT